MSKQIEDFKKSYGIVSLDENRKGILSLGLDASGNEILVGFKDSAFAADHNGEFNLKKEGLVFFKLFEGRAHEISCPSGTDGSSSAYTECLDAFKKANFSNYGNTMSVSAPGEHIYSALPNGSFGYLDGTSMAAPIVAGTIGLMKSISPNLKIQEIYNILYKTGVKTNNSNMGPVLQIKKALLALGL